ncbi:class I SAM-dependent methyltransferase [Pseudonocardia sp. C8]|uniref:class I SAM-dependent methyltransferase n=1 Tax=Pseudonocardia sp. C8 TaxID=2762759 RepID=UPI0016430715|nr:class I SAM-dependent methyltransferase [Pseudonocardia sp. C8]MBC3191841.1 class I SAM-dependent methyltransferase [Pseudonocardia sp. C8]
MSYPEYDASAPYVHLLSVPMWEPVRPRLAAALADVDPSAGTILELSPGSGLGTETILATVPGAPVLAAEPSAALRAVLLGRLDRVPGGERVTVHPSGAAEVPLPDRLSAVVGMHMVGHLPPADRRALWGAVAARLAPGAPVVLLVQLPDTAVAVPPFPPMEVVHGGLAYQGTGSAEPTGPESVRWTMEYRTLDGERELEHVVTGYDWWIVSADELAGELRAAGLTVRLDDDLVVGTR